MSASGAPTHWLVCSPLSCQDSRRDQPPLLVRVVNRRRVAFAPALSALGSETIGHLESACSDLVTELDGVTVMRLKSPRAPVAADDPVADDEVTSGARCDRGQLLQALQRLETSAVVGSCWRLMTCAFAALIRANAVRDSSSSTEL